MHEKLVTETSVLINLDLIGRPTQHQDRGVRTHTHRCAYGID